MDQTEIAMMMARLTTLEASVDAIRDTLCNQAQTSNDQHEAWLAETAQQRKARIVEAMHILNEDETVDLFLIEHVDACHRQAVRQLINRLKKALVG